MDQTDTVKRLLAEICGIESASIRDDGRLVSYGLDSVRATDFIIAIEEEFGVFVNQADAAELRTVADVVAYIKQHRGAPD